MITICGMLEKGWESNMEHLVWRQLKGAFGVNLILVPFHYKTMEEALKNLKGKKVFLIPPGRIKSINFYNYKKPIGDVNYIFGRPGDNLVRYVTDKDDVVSVHTPNNTDLMAISVVGIILNEYRQQNNN
jgi:hypothetical protein